MRKIKTKKPSSNFEKLVLGTGSKGRSSIIMNDSIGEYFFIKVDKIFPYKKQARKNFSEESINELASTIKEYGIRQPLTVIKRENSGEYEVISGERRLRAAIKVGLEKVPCIILDEKGTAEEIALIENTQRTDLHPIELGEAYKSLMNLSKWGDISKLSLKLGKPVSTISESLSLTKLPTEIKDYVVSNNIKGRALFRKLQKCKSVEEMKSLLGEGPSEEKKKNKLKLLEVSIVNGDITIHSINRKIDEHRKKDFIQKLKLVIDKLEK